MLRQTALGKPGGKTTSSAVKSDGWEIPLDLININELIGSGSHGTVFLAELNGEKMALKRVREESETRIDHLRRLNHRNIIKLRWVIERTSLDKILKVVICFYTYAMAV